MNTVIIIEGVNRTDEIADYYINNKSGLICIKFKNHYKYYSYSKNKVTITPTIMNTINNDELIVCHKNNEYVYISGVTRYLSIGDKVTCVMLPRGEIYYKTENIKIERLDQYQLTAEQYVMIKGKISKVSLMEYSEHFVRIQFDGKSEQYIYKKNEIQIKEHNNIRFSNYLNYYKEIARMKDTHISDKVEEYLEKQINNILLQKETALNSFFCKENQTYHDNYQKIYPFGINLSQRDAILNAAKHKISLIQGPPGTGKTQSILNIIANIIVRNQTVAVVSSNNEAIKNVKEKLEKYNYGFLVALLGNVENKDLFFKNQPKYPDELLSWKKTDNEMELLLVEIKEHENNLITLLENQNKVASLKQKIFEYKHEHSFFQEYLQNNEVKKLKRFTFFRLNKDKILELLIDLNINMSERIKILKKIKYFLRYGIFDFHQFDKLDSIILDLQDIYYKAIISELETESNLLVEVLNNKNFDDELEQLTLKSQLYFKAYLSKRFLENKRRHFSLDTYFHDEVFTEFIGEYPIIISTTHAISKSINQGYLFDYLIVDEASQVELVPGIIALNTAKKAVIVGDLKQLPHIPEETIKSKQYDEWHNYYSIPLEFNYSKQSLLSSCNIIFGNKDADVLLKEHYRCHSQIISFCNKKYYNNELICHSKVFSEKPLVLLRTAKGNHMRYGQNAVNKITNIRELESLVDQDFLSEIELDAKDKKSFGLIAPFRGQANAAKEILPSEFQKDTVHKFQGRECDVIMFSSVLDKKTSSKHRMKFVDEPHLINVAVSRAIEKFILVSNVDVFKQNKGDINDLIRYMEYYEEDSVLYQSNVRSVFDLLYSDYSELLNKKMESLNWNRSNYNSENLIHELLQSIVLEDRYSKYRYQSEVKMKELLREVSNLSFDEITYIQNNARIDFLIYNKFDNQPILAIEVDGFEYHENKPQQLTKDKLKDSILKKYDIPILRLQTNHANEEEKIKSFL